MPDSVEDNVACRICMDPKDSYVSLFSHDLSKKVMEVADVQVKKDDGLPDTICTECEHDLEKCYEFRVKVQDADKKFREIIKCSQVDIEECNIKEESYMDDGNPDNMDDKDSVSMDDEHYNDELGVAQKAREEVEEAKPDPLNHVVVVEEKERQIKMPEDSLTQYDTMTEEPQVPQKIEEVALDPLACMKEETETEIMDVDSNQPDPFGPSSSVRSTALPNSFSISSSTLSSEVSSVKNEFEVQKPPSKITEPGQYQTVEKERPEFLPFYLQDGTAQGQITVDRKEQSYQDFMLMPQTGVNLINKMLIPCVQVTPKSIAIPKSYAHSLDSNPTFVSPNHVNIRNAITAVTNIDSFSTQQNSVSSLSSMSTVANSHVDNQNISVQPTMTVEGEVPHSNSTRDNQPTHDQEEAKDDEEFWCSVCYVYCGNTEILDEHKSETEFICRVCTSVFNNHQDLENHFYSHKKFKCEVCKKAFYVKGDLRRHKNTTCNKPAKEKCKLCSNKFVHKKNLEIHMTEKHSNAQHKVIPCLICKSQFKTQSQLNHHMRSEHTAHEDVVCNICHKIVSGPEKLKRHMKYTHLKKSPECCPICKKVFFYKYAYKLHMEKHDGEEEVCNICGVVVKGKRTLKQHIYHHETKRHYCSYCNIAFKSQTERDKHYREKHSKSKPAICEVCGKEYKSMQILRNHMVTHSDEKPFVCDVCGAAFKSKTVLKTHTRIHSDLRKYTCNHCGEAFRWKQTFDKHVLKCESSENDD